MVWTSLVICTNTRLVHPTWLAHTIPVGVSFNVSMRPLLSMLFELSLVFIAFWPMIEILWHYIQFLKFGCAILGWCQ